MSITPKVDTIDLRIRNVSGRVAKLTWDEAVFVDFDDTANRMGHGEPTTIETERSQVPSVIPPDKILQETVFPMNRVYRGVETRAETSSACMRQCQQTAYTCMAAYNCSGYRSRNQYPSNYAFLQAIANNIEAGLCERRCLDQRHACFGTCTELKQVDTGLRHLPIRPQHHQALHRKGGGVHGEGEKAGPDPLFHISPLLHCGQRQAVHVEPRNPVRLLRGVQVLSSAGN